MNLQRTTGLIFLGYIFLAGCSAERLRVRTVNSDATRADMLYEMALSNIAMARYYNFEILPWCYVLGAGNIAVNDSIGVNPGLVVGLSVSHVFAPSISFPSSRTF